MEYLRTRRERRVLHETTQSQSQSPFQSATALTRTNTTSDLRPPFTPGSQLHGGRFTINEVIGTGGEGVVYKAWDHSLEQYVAVKTLHVTDASHVTAIKREFRFLQGLSHPSLVQLHELVVERQLSFFSMSLVEGRNFLQALTDEHSLRALIVQLAEVVAFLHSTGRVHRDIKASNILVREDGSLVLLDFGVALNLSRPPEERRGPTGTPRYMAPELLLNQPASEESDAYSIGVLLYEALTGTHPNPSGRTEIGQAHSKRPSDIVPNIAADLDDLCFELLAPRPNERATVQTIIQRLGDRKQKNSQWVTYGRRCDVYGRDYELSQLKNAFLRMQQAYAPVVALVEAPSGLGKTAFVEEFLSQQENVVILRSKCSEHELVTHKAIDGIIEDLIDYLVTLDPEHLFEIIPLAEASILVQLFPELRRLPGFEDTPLLSPHIGEYRALRMRAYLALAGVLGRLSDGCELIIFVDDLHWGDVDSGRLLREVFAGAERPHCLLILAYRPEEQAHSECMSELLDGPLGLSSELQNITIILDSLSRRDSRSLALDLTQQLSISDQDLSTIVAESRGSPLLLTELVSHYYATNDTENAVHNGIDGIVAHRVAGLSPELKRAFCLLCCAGVPLSLNLVNALANSASVDLLVGLTHQRLARSRKGGQVIEVFHDSIREAMVRRLGDNATEYHAALAAELVTRNGDPAEIARHYFASGDIKQGSFWAEIAAEQANRSFAFARAADLFLLARSAEDNSQERYAQLSRRLAFTYAALGRGADAAPLFLKLAEQCDEPQATELRTYAASHFLISGNAQQGLMALSQVHKAVGLFWPVTKSQTEYFFLSERLKLRFALAGQEAEGTPLSDKRRAQMDACRAALHLGLISILHASGSSARYLRFALQSREPGALVVGYGMEAIYRATAGSSQKAAVSELKQKAKACVETLPSPYHQAFLYYVEGQCHYLMGEMKQSTIYYDKAEQGFIGQGHNVSWELNSARVMYSQALSMLGRLNVWEKRLADWTADAEARGDMCLLSAAHIGLARLEILKNGDVVTARQLVAEGTRKFETSIGGTHYFAAQFALSFADNYDQDQRSALIRLTNLRREMKLHHMTRVQIPRAHLNFHEAHCCIGLAHALRKTNEHAPYLKRARFLARQLQAERAAWTDAFALQIQASCDLQESAKPQSLENLEKAEQLFALLDFGLFRAATSVRIGEIRGGDEGRARINEARAHFRSLGIFDFDQATAAFAPPLGHI